MLPLSQSLPAAGNCSGTSSCDSVDLSGTAAGLVGADERARRGSPACLGVPREPTRFKPAFDDGSLRYVPGSSRAYTLSQLRDFFMAPDWHPDDHPVMPDVVALGRKPDVYACGFCHRADGRGGPENANIAGLPAGYIVQQMADFKKGSPQSSVPSRLPPQRWSALSVAASAAEIDTAAAYFSALQPERHHCRRNGHGAEVVRDRMAPGGASR